jgi:aspartate aminotransferase-like enzyme
MNYSEKGRPYKLFTPGPVNIPSRVASAMSYISLHHRMAEFSYILNEMLENLKPLFGTNQPILPVHTTGRGALEGVYNNLLTEKDLVLSICNGKFGEMAATTLKCIGISCIECFNGWDAQVDLRLLEQMIIEHKPTAITAVHNDTSNAVVNPIADIGELAKKYGLLLIVDTVSGLGCMPFNFDEWSVDAAVTASQKGLMSPAGISFVTLSDRAIKICEDNTPRDYYINLTKIRKDVLSKGETPGSTPVSLVIAVNEALKMIHDEGLEYTFERHKKLSISTQEAVQKMGFSLFPQICSNRSNSLTVFQLSDGINAVDVVSHLRQKYHILIAKGLGPYANNTLRVAHMGHCHVEDMLQLISALEATLFDLGYVKSVGLGTDAFIRKYNEFLA